MRKCNTKKYNDSCCGNCSYSQYDEEMETYICKNENSYNYEYPTSYGDDCSEFEVQN